MAGYEIILAPETFDGAALYARFVDAHKGCGAIVSFSGRVRAESGTEAVSALYLDWYPGMTERSLEAIAQAAMARFDIVSALVVHRCGEVRAEAEIVFVATASAHRRAAFEAADYLMDRLKSEAAFWKREVGPDIDRWIEPTEKDNDDLQRWQRS